MIVMISNSRYYISGQGSWPRNMARLLVFAKRELPERVKNILLWTTWTRQKRPNKGKLTGYWVLANHTKKGWKVSDIYTCAKINFLGTSRQILRYDMVNEMYYCSH